MEFRYNRTVAPTTTPITLDEAKSQLREEDDDYNAEITTLVAAATEYLDGPRGVLGRCIVTQTYEVSCDFPERAGANGSIPIRLGYLQSLTSIAYVDANGDTQTVDLATVNVITGEPGMIYLKNGASWPSTDPDTIDPVTITVVVGYPSDGSSPTEDALRANIPEGLRHAIKFHVSHLFENRDIVAFGVSAIPVPKTYDALIAPYRITGHGDG